MENAYIDDLKESIKNDIFSLWINSYSEKETDEFKIFDLSQKFNVSTKTIIESVKDELKTDYLKTLSTEELKGMYLTLKIHKESTANKLQMEIIESVLYDRNK